MYHYVDVNSVVVIHRSRGYIGTTAPIKVPNQRSKCALQGYARPSPTVHIDHQHRISGGANQFEPLVRKRRIGLSFNTITIQCP